MKLTLDRGLKIYEVEDIDGTPLGTIKINPADLGIVGRLAQTRDTLAAMAEKINDNIDPKMLNEIDANVKAEINNIFNSDVAPIFFGSVSALALCDDGTMVFEKVLNAIAPIIEDAVGEGNGWKSTLPPIAIPIRALPLANRHECLGITHYRRSRRAEICNTIRFSRRTRRFGGLG